MFGHIGVPELWLVLALGLAQLLGWMLSSRRSTPTASAGNTRKEKEH